jgi:predicted anti-sigma-YlaC factor YlaD
MSVCNHMREQLSDFLDGTLDSGRSVVLTAHLEECMECRREYNALKSTVDMLRSSAVPDGIHAQRRALTNLRATLRAEAPQKQFAGFRISLVPITGVIAATLVWLIVSRSPSLPPNNGYDPQQLVAQTTPKSGLPTSFELDEMASRHAVHSFAIAAGDAGEQQETLADATSRLSTR